MNEEVCKLMGNLEGQSLLTQVMADKPLSPDAQKAAKDLQEIQCRLASTSAPKNN